MEIPPPLLPSFALSQRSLEMGEMNFPTLLLIVSLLGNVLLVIIGLDARWSGFDPPTDGVNSSVGNYLFSIIGFQ